MSKREIIIVLVSVLIGLYGLLDYLFFSNQSKTNTPAAITAHKKQIEELVTTANAGLSSIDAINKQVNYPYVLTRIETAWQNDPFVSRSSQNESKQIADKGKEDVVHLVYSGFIQVGNEFMAVVNGMEYLTGDIIQEIGYKIKRITPTRVILMTQADKEIILLLEDN
ncbi:MAG: hypothetical protein ABIJ31_04515 [Pseudomonadota bacterium]